MKTSLKTGFAQTFSCCAPPPPSQNGGLPKIWVGSPARTPLNQTKKDKLFFKQLLSSYLFGCVKNISLS